MFGKNIKFSYAHIKTLGEYKAHVEKHGTGKLSHIGINGLARLNESLTEKGIEPFKIGGPVSERYLSRYGLVKSPK